ncbi:hypothetical protein C8R43DRAFT_1137865 [Mycena crocata]|nr:hypothetical protein C8R43DRAFT_1137865 [Mycena crocata]
MSTYTKYGAAPAAPAYGLFPAGATSPNAFSSLHQSPRATHSMYAQFSTPAAAGAPSAHAPSSGQGSVSKRFSMRNACGPLIFDWVGGRAASGEARGRQRVPGRAEHTIQAATPAHQHDTTIV